MTTNVNGQLLRLHESYHDIKYPILHNLYKFQEIKMAIVT